MNVINNYLYKIPSDLKPNAYGIVDDSDIRVRHKSYDLCRERPDFVHDEKSWVELRQIVNGYPQELRLPVAYQGFTPDCTFLERATGYVPLICFHAAYNEFAYGLSLIFKRAIPNNFIAMREKKLKDSLGHYFLNSVRYRAHLNLTQRLVVIAFGIMMIFRALVDCLQIGIIFAPFDYLFSHYFPTLGPRTKKSDFKLIKV